MTRPTTTGKAQDLITFTRSTTGTYLDSITYGDELVTNGTFDSNVDGWSSYSSALSWENGGYLRATQTGSYGGAFQNISVEIGKSYVYEISTVGGTASVATIQLKGTGQAIAYKPITVGEKGFLYFVATASTVEIDMQVQSPTSGLYVDFDSASVKEVIGGQGTQGTPLLRTAAINEARIEYDASGNCLGLLVEEARTNLHQYSNQANQLAYHGDGVTTGVDTAEVTSPEGSGTVIKLNKTSSGFGFARLPYGSITNAQTLSAFVKKGTARYIGFRQLAPTATHTTFDLETNTWVQTIGSTSRGYEDYGNGWLRLWVVSDDSNSKAWVSLCITNSGGTETNNETGTVYVYGIQRESGSFPTSYIPTSGSAVTRAADVASLAVSEFGYNQDQGTVFINCLIVERPSTNRRVIDGNSNNKRWMYVNSPDDNYGLKYYDGTNNINLVNSGIPLNMKAAVAVTPTQVFGAANSSAVGSGAHSGTLLDISQFNFFANLTGHIKSIQYYPLRLSNAQLQALTV